MENKTYPSLGRWKPKEEAEAGTEKETEEERKEKDSRCAGGAKSLQDQQD